MKVDMVGLMFKSIREFTDSITLLGSEVTVTGVIMRRDVFDTLGDATLVWLTNALGIIVIRGGFVLLEGTAVVSTKSLESIFSVCSISFVIGFKSTIVKLWLIVTLIEGCLVNSDTEFERGVFGTLVIVTGGSV